MSYNFDYEAAKALKAVLEALDPCPDLVQIIPAGAEKDIPDEAKAYWINIAIKDNDIVQETSNSYIGKTILEVNIGVRSNKCLGSIAETLTAAATDMLVTLSTSSLGGYARRASNNISIAGYSGGETTTAVYWYSATFEYEHQVNA